MCEEPVEEPRVPARIFVLLAREEPIGLVVRRGPTKKVCTIRWDRNTDQFQLGQWIKGRIYSHRCDLSPDGRYFLYFAANYGRSKPPLDGSWTGLSRVPYMKALGLWAKGDGWNGGGCFLDDSRYWINEGLHDNAHRTIHEAEGFERVEHSWDVNRNGEWPGVYVTRLLRDGWMLVSRRDPPSRPSDLLRRELPGGWLIEQTVDVHDPRRSGTEVDFYALRHPQTSRYLTCDDWTWADYDPIRNRLVWASDGCLHTGELNEEGLGETRVIHDFNAMSFRAVRAPY